MIRVVLNTLAFRIFNLLSREAIFLAVFMINMAGPLGIKQKMNCASCSP